MEDLKELLDQKYREFNQLDFIQNDPISIPHQFEDKNDIEVSGFLTATISWGNRAAILKSAHKWMEMMGEQPYDFVMTASKGELDSMKSFYYRTFQGEDVVCFLMGLRRIYNEFGGLHVLFLEEWKKGNGIEGGLSKLRNEFFTSESPTRSFKHLANIKKNSSCKRLNMFLRWMVRKDKCGVDFGLWNDIPPSALFLPLDVHTGNVARKLGLLNRKANDWKAVKEVTANLRVFDSNDPVKYDFSLFGMGIEKYF